MAASATSTSSVSIQPIAAQTRVVRGRLQHDDRRASTTPRADDATHHVGTSAAPGAAPATAPTDAATRWIGVLFAIGSACFLVGPFPGFVELVGSGGEAAPLFSGPPLFSVS